MRPFLAKKLLLHFHVGSHLPKIGGSNTFPYFLSNTFVRLHFIKACPQETERLLHEPQYSRYGICPD
jgi:hypothetical protein